MVVVMILAKVGVKVFGHVGKLSAQAGHCRLGNLSVFGVDLTIDLVTLLDSYDSDGGWMAAIILAKRLLCSQSLCDLSGVPPRVEKGVDGSNEPWLNFLVYF
jgi:hypothetical protein